MNRALFKAKLSSIEALGEGAAELTFQGSIPEIMPGQFVMLRFPDPAPCYLPRPFSVSQASRDLLRLMVVSVGEGSDLLIRQDLGFEATFWGPLGQGFRPIAEGEKVACVGGGFGVAPLAFLFERALVAGQDLSESVLIYGARDRRGLRNLSRMEALPCQVLLATDDGSRGQKARAPELLAGLGPVDRVLSCGPMAMMTAVASYADQQGIPAEMSLETHMACGYGVCNGCTHRQPDGTFIKICVDGPVLAGSSLV